jgi:hypothetical protein
MLAWRVACTGGSAAHGADGVEALDRPVLDTFPLERTLLDLLLEPPHLTQLQKIEGLNRGTL